jgi:hypothetical protein
MLKFLLGASVYKGENILILAPKMLKELGMQELDAAVPKKLKAVLAHEMSHTFHGDLRLGGAKM